MTKKENVKNVQNIYLIAKYVITQMFAKNAKLAFI